ncbi:hypothetical protein [uncultured Oscillibacter sp.]|uniref:hypothetical protein n=1 Tax=uncultured Oscillibacter sp. TaxID=876091 RepID=UPI002624C742|nr:hypothetical protein [uncultured Oscillibacter sp.]
MSGCIVVRAGLCTASHTCIGYFNRETLEPDFDVMDKYERREKREALEAWVGDICQGGGKVRGGPGDAACFPGP